MEQEKQYKPLEAEVKRQQGNPNLTKGVTLNPKGRPKGSQNATSKQIREMITDFLVDKAYPTLFRKFERLSDKLQIEFVTQVTKFAAPTLAATKIEADVNNNQPMKIQIVYNDEDKGIIDIDPNSNIDEAEIIDEDE